MLNGLLHPKSWPEAVVTIAVIVAVVLVGGQLIELARHAIKR